MSMDNWAYEYEKRKAEEESEAEAVKIKHEGLAKKASALVENLFGRKISTSSFRDFDSSDRCLTCADDTVNYALFNPDFSGANYKEEFDLWGRVCKNRFDILRESVDYKAGHAGYMFRSKQNG